MNIIEKKKIQVKIYQSINVQIHIDKGRIWICVKGAQIA